MTSNTSNHETTTGGENNNDRILSSSSNDRDNVVTTVDEHSQYSATKNVYAGKPDLNTRVRNHFKQIFGTIFVKPQGRPPNIFKQLVSLNTKQRLAFTAGKFCASYIDMLSSV